MRKHAVVVILAALHVLALLLLAFYGSVMRPDLIATYGLALGEPALSAIPRTTRVALSAWWAPIVGGVGLCNLASASFVRGANLRTRIIAAGLVWTVFGLAFAMGAAYAPVFERLE